MKKQNYLFRGKKGVVQILAPITLGMVIIMAVLFGIPFSAIAFFIIQNGKLLVIIFALLLFYKLFKK